MASNIIIENDGDVTPLNEALSSVTTESKSVQAELKAVNQLLKFEPSDTEATAQKQKSLGDAWKTFGNHVKNAGQAAVASVTEIGARAAAAGKAVWSMAQDTAAATGEIDKQRNEIGLTAEAYQEWDYILSQNGIEITSVSTGLKTLVNKIDDARNGSSSAQEMFGKLGISMEKLNGMSREEAFETVIKGMQGMEDSTERAALANDLFGKSGQTMSALFNQTAESTDALKQKAHEYGMVLSNDAVSAGVEFTDSLDAMNRTFTGVKNGIVANMLPGLTQLTNGFTDLVAGQEGAGDAIKLGVETMLASFQEFMPQLITVMQTIIETIIIIAPDIISTLVQGLLGCLPMLFEAVFQILQSLSNSITGNIQMVVDVIMLLVTAILTFIIMNLPQFIDMGINIIVALINGIATALPQIIQAIVDMIPKLIQTITDNLPFIIQAGITLLLSLIQGIISAIPQLLEALPTIISALLDGILLAVPQLINAGIQLLTALVTALPEIIQKIVEVLPQIMASIITALINNLPLLIEAGIKLFLALITAMPTIIIEIVKAVPQIIKGLIDAIISFVPKIADCGLNLIQGLWNGIKDAGAWLWDKISGFFGGIVDKIKGFFGIHSPSTLFRDMIGKNLVKGISVGVDMETPDLQKNLEKNLGDVTAGLQATIAAESAKLSVEPNGAAVGTNLGGLTFHIEKFVNNTDKDLRQLTEEAMEVAEEYIRRKRGVFA